MREAPSSIDPLLNSNTFFSSANKPRCISDDLFLQTKKLASFVSVVLLHDKQCLTVSPTCQARGTIERCDTENGSNTDSAVRQLANRAGRLLSNRPDLTEAGRIPEIFKGRPPSAGCERAPWLSPLPTLVANHHRPQGLNEELSASRLSFNPASASVSPDQGPRGDGRAGSSKWKRWSHTLTAPGSGEWPETS